MDSLYHFCKYLDEKVKYLEAEIRLYDVFEEDASKLHETVRQIKITLEVVEEERLRLLEAA